MSNNGGPAVNTTMVKVVHFFTHSLENDMVCGAVKFNTAMTVTPEHFQFLISKQIEHLHAIQVNFIHNPFQQHQTNKQRGGWTN